MPETPLTISPVSEKARGVNRRTWAALGETKDRALPVRTLPDKMLAVVVPVALRDRQETPAMHELPFCAHAIFLSGVNALKHIVLSAIDVTGLPIVETNRAINP